MDEHLPAQIVVDQGGDDADLGQAQPEAGILGLVLHDEGDGVAALEAGPFEVGRDLVAQLLHVQERHPVVLHDEGGLVRVALDDCLEDFGHGEAFALPQVQDEVKFDEAVDDSGGGKGRRGK